MSEVGHRTEWDVKLVAEELGLSYFIALSDEVFIDWDYRDDPPSFSGKMYGYMLTDRLVTVSKSGHRHAYYRIDKRIGDRDQIKSQKLLLSDPVKEKLSLLRVSAGSDASVVLFETEQEAARVREWRGSNNQSTDLL
jgi:hypothetical protein